MNIGILMINEDIRIEEARQAILSTLRRIPELSDVQVEMETWTEKNRADLLVSFRKQNDRKTLLVEVDSSGQPRPARAAVNSLIALLSSRSGTTHLRCLSHDLQGKQNRLHRFRRQLLVALRLDLYGDKGESQSF